MRARAEDEATAQAPVHKRAKGDGKGKQVSPDKHAGDALGGKVKAVKGKATGVSGQTWAQSAEKYIKCIVFARQSKQDKVDLLHIMVVGEGHDGVRAVVS